MELAAMSFVWDFLIISVLGLAIVFILIFLLRNSSPNYETVENGVPAKVQAFVDDIVQNIRDIQITDQLRDFWKNAERVFRDQRSDSRSSTQKSSINQKGSINSKRKTIPKTPKQTLKHENRCFMCGTSVSGGKFCPNCGVEHQICPICRKPVWYGEKILECPFCKMIAHAPHLLEWLRVRGTCPNCRKKLKPQMADT